LYVTTDEEAARGYASRYLTGSGQPVPGDLYEVAPVGRVALDPDHRLFPEAFARCPKARITRVVARAVVLSDVEQAQRLRPYTVWGAVDRPVWDDDGLILPSEQMLDNGVTRQWTTLLRPWLGQGDVDPFGGLLIAARSPDFWATVLEVVPSLDRGHRVVRRRWPGRPRYRSSRPAPAATGPQADAAAA
jgi:hypothetical protein